jgi:hypothetical protein
VSRDVPEGDTPHGARPDRQNAGLPPWAVGVIAAAGTVVAMVGLLLVVALPFLSRVDALLTDVEDTLPVVHELRPEVGRIDANVDHVTPRFGQMQDQLGHMEGALGDVSDPVVRMERHTRELLDAIDTLEEMGGHVEALPGLQRDFGHVADDLGGMRDDFTHVRGLMEELVVALEVLGDGFGDVVELLEEMSTSVDNLDRKTGPPPPEGHLPW